MATSPRLGLNRPTTSDAFTTATLAANIDLLDDSPGILVTTVADRATDTSGWGAGQAGRWVYETDGFLWVWTGSAFVRKHGVGRLGGVSSTSNFSTASQSAVTVVQTTVTVPVGGRAVQIIANAPYVSNSNGFCFVSLFRGATQLEEWSATGNAASGTAGSRQNGRSFSLVDTGASAGSTTYHFKARSDSVVAGTTTLNADTLWPISLNVIEL